MDRLYVGSKIRMLRRKKKLTQKELAKLVDVSPASIAAYETGDKIPRDDVKEKMAKVLDSTVTFIFFENDIN